jgi:hypothetical protein
MAKKLGVLGTFLRDKISSKLVLEGSCLFYDLLSLNVILAPRWSFSRIFGKVCIPLLRVLQHIDHMPHITRD